MRALVRVTLIFLVLAWGLTPAARAQAQPSANPPENPKAQILDQQSAASKAAAKAPKKQEDAPFEAPPLDSEPASVSKYQEALREYYQYQIVGLMHRQRVFQWQFVTSIVIFFVVLVLVGAGIYFAAVQFQISLTPVKDADGSTKPAPTTQFKASLQGVEVSSSILGVIILVISLAFFYLYLVYVYPIVEIF